MKPFTSRTLTSILALLLCFVLLQTPAYAYQSQGQSKQFDGESCRRLLESITPLSGQDLTKASASSSSWKRLPRILDFTKTNAATLHQGLAAAKADDIILLDETRLAAGAYTSLLSSALPLFSIATTSGRQTVDPILQAKAGAPEIVVTIPTTADGVENVFGVPRINSEPIVKYMTETYKTYRQISGSHVLNFPENGRQISDSVLDRAKRDTTAAYILVAHNVHGVLKFPDASELRVDALYRALSKGRVAIVLSCDTINAAVLPVNELLTNRTLDFRDIAVALQSVQKRFTATSDLAVGSLLLAISQAIPHARSMTAHTVKVVALIAGTLVVVGLLYFWICEDSETDQKACK